MQRSFDDSNISSTTLTGEDGLSAGFAATTHIAVAHVVASLATFWRLRFSAPSDERPPEIAIFTPILAFWRLCLCFHETCANPSETEKSK